MRISIHADKAHFFIPLPNGLILNGFTTGLAASCLQKHRDIPLTAEQLNCLSAELKRIKKTYGKLTLVDIRTHDGQSIKITL